MNRPITLCSISLLLFLSLCVKAQNLVYNGDFEIYSTCPTGLSAMANCGGWRQYNNGTADYFNVCVTSGGVSVPVNTFGYQQAASGNAYAGTIAISEYIAGHLTPMKAGRRYEISLSVSLANTSQYGYNGLGVWLYDNGPAATLSTSGIPGPAQVIFADTVIDTANWVRLKAKFDADSSYDNIVIGALASTYAVQISSSGGATYYYYDSVVVRTVDAIRMNFKDTSFCTGDTMVVPFTAYSNYFATNNVFTLQLSAPGGSFVSGTTDLGTISNSTGDTFRCVIPSTVGSASNYRIRIKANNVSDSSDDNGYNIDIGRFPSISLSANTPVCTGRALNIGTTTSNSGVSYSWTGPNNFVSSVQNPALPAVTLAAAGSYKVRAAIYSCAITDSISVVVNQSPASVTASSTGSGCEPATISLSSTNSSSGVAYTWTGPNTFSSSQQSPVITNAPYANAGRYYVTATATNGCFVKDSVDVTIKPLPQNFSIISNNPQCQGNTLSMNGSTTSTGVTWAWSGPGSYSSTSQNISFTNAQPSISGNYILAATLNGCTAIDTLAARVIAIPAVPNPTANTPVCVGQTLSLNAGSAGPSYLWSGPNSFVSTSQAPSIGSAATAVAGTYTVKAIDGGCISADGSVTVTVIAAPTAGMYPSPKDSICEGTPVTFNGFASNAGTGYAIRWFRNSLPISGATGTQYTDAHTADYDSYYCTVTSNGTCAIPYTDTSNIVVMRVFPWLVPSVSITSTATGQEVGGDLISFTATPVNGGNYPGYQWKRNNKNELGALSYTWGARTLSDKDVVCVEMTSSYLCPQPKTAMSNCITVRVNTTGIVNTERMQGIKIYPNPVTDELKIEGIATGTEITITDVLGRTVSHNMATNETETIHAATWAKGTYLLQLNDKDGKHMAAVVVKQ